MHERLFFQALDAAGGAGGDAVPQPAATPPAPAPGGGDAAAGAPAPAPAAGGDAGKPGSLMARGATTPTAAPSPAGQAAAPVAQPAAFPDKFLVKNEDGSTNWEASALKQHTEGYSPLESKLHAGEAPPKTPDDYAPEVAGLDVKAMAADPLYKGFLKGAHGRGLSNADVSWVLGEWQQREAMRNSPEAGEAELRKTWTDDAAMQQGLARSFRATAAFAGDADTRARLEAKFGNDPDFIRFTARMGAELGEDKPVGGITSAESDTLETLMASEAYNDKNHREHATVVARTKALYAKKFPEPAN